LAETPLNTVLHNSHVIFQNVGISAVLIKTLLAILVDAREWR